MGQIRNGSEVKWKWHNEFLFSDQAKVITVHKTLPWSIFVCLKSYVFNSVQADQLVNYLLCTYPLSFWCFGVNVVNCPGF